MKRGEQGLTLVETMMVICIIGFIFVIALPNLLRARQEANAKLCVANLKQIESAKERWYWTAKAHFGTEIYMSDLVPDFMKSSPVCPAQGTYTVRTIQENPICSIGKNNTADLFDDHELAY